MKIIIVGDKPSSKNKDPNIAFVGTPSYKVLLNWLYEMDININNVILCNKEHVIKYTYINEFYIQTEDGFYDLYEEDKFIALGNNAHKFLHKNLLCHYWLPHPSPKNRKLNDKKYIENELKLCKDWLEGGHKSFHQASYNSVISLKSVRKIEKTIRGLGI